MKKILILFLLLISCASQSQTVRKLSLNPGWEFREVGTEKWYPAEVPGCVHTDLLRNGLIPDPYFSDNEKKLQWIETKDWEYKKDFILDSIFLKEYVDDLTFEGLDTYADVYINNEYIYRFNNMFVNIDFDIHYYLKDSNTIHIIFRSPVRLSDSIATAYYKTEGIKGLPGGNQVFTRKAAYQFGWDFAPRYVTCGIWRDVYLEAYSKAKVGNFITSINKLTNDEAILNFKVNFKIAPFYTDNLCTYLLTDANENIIYDSSTIDFHFISDYPYIYNFSLNASISSPKLWWCNGMGEPYLYTFKFIIKLGDKRIDEKTIKVGIRDVELVREMNENGESFYFKLNGKPVFIKGANYVPADIFPSQVTKEKYRGLLTTAKETNMNMLRIWGGGIYENNYFYDLCDSLGIMIWQDLMFACSMYPGDDDFSSNVSKEVANNFERLCNHPCIALWCGNNESDEGWKNWGWQKQFGYTAKDSEKIWNDYVNLFENKIPIWLKFKIIISDSDKISYDTINSYSNQNYIPTSPKIGWGHDEAMNSGDSHYWGVWWGSEPFETYKIKVPGFMSEYGFQSLPDIETLESFSKPEDLNLNSVAIKSHQKHPSGFQLINDYMQRDFNVPDDFQEYIDASQNLQTYGYKIAIEAHRRAKPYCMGTMYWQLNDCWPAVSWSSIDYFGRYKDIIYKLKDLYADILVSPLIENDSLKIYIVSDRQTNSGGKLFLELINDISGDTLWTNVSDVSLPDNSSAVYFADELTSVLKNFNKDELFFSCRYIDSADLKTYTNKLIFVKPKNYKGTTL
jgi:beta-mannosidase